MSRSGFAGLRSAIFEARADGRGCQFQKRFVDVQASIKSDSQLAKASKPSVRSLRHPAVLSELFDAFNAAAGNADG